MRSKRRAGVLLASAAAIVASLAGPASSSVAATPDPSAVPSGTPSQAQWKQLDKIAKSQDALGVFGASTPVVVLPADAPGAQKATVMADIPTGMKVTVKTSKFTKNELGEMEKVISGNRWHKDAKKYGQGFSYDGEKDKVVVNTDAPESVTASLKKSYGDKIEVLRSRFEQQADRFHDVEAFYGGASLDSDRRWGPCTSGWKLRFVNPEDGRAADFLTTAGHCYNLNERIMNENYGALGNWMGWVKKVDDTLDIEAFVGYRYSPHIYTGIKYDSTDAKQASTSLSGMWNGMMVCVSGRTSYKHCNHPITATAYGFNWMDHHGVSHHTASWDGFAYAPGPGPSYAGIKTQSGDSGAPVYVDYSPYTVLPTGSHAGITSWWDGPCSCTQTRMYAVKMGSVLSKWQATLPSQ
jgi:hypothetical protein